MPEQRCGYWADTDNAKSNRGGRKEVVSHTMSMATSYVQAAAYPKSEHPLRSAHPMVRAPRPSHNYGMPRRMIPHDLLRRTKREYREGCP